MSATRRKTVEPAPKNSATTRRNGIATENTTRIATKIETAAGIGTAMKKNATGTGAATRNTGIGSATETDIGTIADDVQDRRAETAAADRRAEKTTADREARNEAANRADTDGQATKWRSSKS